MNRLITLLCVALIILSCGSSKKVAAKKKHPVKVKVVKTKTPKIEPVDEVVITETPEVYNSPVEKYIAIYSDIAQDEMRNYNVPASITLAQGILESGSGKARLAVEGNNHFGIKCHKEWTGGRIYHDDDKAQECFRKYKNSKYSFRDHSLFLKDRSRYAGLFKLDKSDYKAWAKGLRVAGYATDKKYPQKLISLIERYQLYRFDNQVLGVESNQNDRHSVVAGDTLYSLSKKYKISVAELKSLNSLDSNDLFVGQVLFVKPLPKD